VHEFSPRWDAPDDGDDDAGLPPMLGQGDVAYGTPGGSRAYPESTEENAGSVLTWQGGEAYEDMCRKYVDRYLKGVENFVHQSGLEARVSEWQEKLSPKLEAEEKREVFDIHSYGDRVKTLVSKQSTKTEVPFGKAVAGLPQFDICRAFLATLQLANDGNVEISLKGETDFQPSVCSSHNVFRSLLDSVPPSHQDRCPPPAVNSPKLLNFLCFPTPYDCA